MLEVEKRWLFRRQAQLSSLKKTHGYEHRRGWGPKGTISPKFLGILVILCIERRCRKQNTAVRLKSTDLPAQICVLATPLERVETKICRGSLITSPAHPFNFLYETRPYRGKSILGILYSRLKNFCRVSWLWFQKSV